MSNPSPPGVRSLQQAAAQQTGATTPRLAGRPAVSAKRGRLVVELTPDEATALGDALKGAVG